MIRTHHTHPYRRTRPQQRTRLTEVTRNGITEHVPETYTEHVPVPPRDWDHTILTAVTAATAAVLAVSVAWSTASIGDLLARAANPIVAYGAATVFDTAWIIFMAVEWLSRYNPARADLPRKAGHVSLAVAMAAVCAHGALTGTGGILSRSTVVGIVGAVISAIAKTVWTVTIRHTAKPLDALSQGWVDKRMADAGTRLAMAAVNRELARAEGQHADAVAALEGSDWPDPDKPSGRPDTVPDDVRSAVLAALALMPGADPGDIVDQLARIGIDTNPDTVRDLSGQADSRSGRVLKLAPHQPAETITDTVRRAVRTHGKDTDRVLAAVRQVHPAAKAETVTRLMSRVG